MKTSKKRQDSPKCPKCGGNLRIIEADPNGRPWCDSLACGYVGAATKTPAPAVWGPREDAHITAVEKWLADEWRDDDEIEAALGDYVTGRRVVGDFYSEMAFERGRKILKAELKARQAQREGRDVARTGDKVTIRKQPLEPQFQTVGKLQIYGDFNDVKHGEIIYQLGKNRQAQAVLKFLANRKAVSRETGVSKSEIFSQLRSENLTGAGEWKPADSFKNDLKPLRKALSCDNRTGCYWIA